MARIKGATMTHKRRKKMLKLAKGFYGCKSKHFKTVSYTHLDVYKRQTRCGRRWRGRCGCRRNLLLKFSCRCPLSEMIFSSLYHRIDVAAILWYNEIKALARQEPSPSPSVTPLPWGEALASRATLRWTPEVQYDAKERASLTGAGASGQISFVKLPQIWAARRYCL